MKEALVIVHADERIVSSVGPDESYRLKNAISERVSSYLFMGKPVLCVPYSQLCGEAPSYLPRDMRHAMETVLVSPSDGSDIIGMHFVPMQALKVRQILL